MESVRFPCGKSTNRATYRMMDVMEARDRPGRARSITVKELFEVGHVSWENTSPQFPVRLVDLSPHRRDTDRGTDFFFFFFFLGGGGGGLGSCQLRNSQEK